MIPRSSNSSPVFLVPAGRSITSSRINITTSCVNSSFSTFKRSVISLFVCKTQLHTVLDKQTPESVKFRSRLKGCRFSWHVLHMANGVLYRLAATHYRQLRRLLGYDLSVETNRLPRGRRMHIQLNNLSLQFDPVSSTRTTAASKWSLFPFHYGGMDFNFRRRGCHSFIKSDGPQYPMYERCRDTCSLSVVVFELLRFDILLQHLGDTFTGMWRHDSPMSRTYNI